VRALRSRGVAGRLQACGAVAGRLAGRSCMQQWPRPHAACSNLRSAWCKGVGSFRAERTELRHGGARCIASRCWRGVFFWTSGWLVGSVRPVWHAHGVVCLRCPARQAHCVGLRTVPLPHRRPSRRVRHAPGTLRALLRPDARGAPRAAGALNETKELQRFALEAFPSYVTRLDAAALEPFIAAELPRPKVRPSRTGSPGLDAAVSGHSQAQCKSVDPAQGVVLRLVVQTPARHRGVHSPASSLLDSRLVRVQHVATSAVWPLAQGLPLAARQQASALPPQGSRPRACAAAGVPGH